MVVMGWKPINPPLGAKTMVDYGFENWLFDSVDGEYWHRPQSDHDPIIEQLCKICKNKIGYRSVLYKYTDKDEYCHIRCYWEKRKPSIESKNDE